MRIFYLICYDSLIVIQNEHLNYFKLVFMHIVPCIPDAWMIKVSTPCDILLNVVEFFCMSHGYLFCELLLLNDVYQQKWNAFDVHISVQSDFEIFKRGAKCKIMALVGVYLIITDVT